MNTETLSKIDEIVSRINTHPEYSSCVAKETNKVSLHEAEKHSLNLEMIAEDRKLSRRERNQFLNNLSNAWDFLCREGISLSSLSDLGYIVEPNNNSKKGFRDIQSRFGGFYPSEPEKIPYHVDDLVFSLEGIQVHPVLRASNAHIELVRIHPYEDGNGRSARLLQNFCLQQRNYPIAIIPSEEREIYIKKLKGVLRDRYNGNSNVENPSPSEIEFHQYITLKVLESAEILESELRSRRMYDIELSKIADKKKKKKVSQRIRDFGRKDNKKIIVSKSNGNGKRKSRKLRVIGDVGFDEVNNLLKISSNMLDFRFALQTAKK